MATTVGGVNTSIFQDNPLQTKTATKDLGKNDFLNLMTAQMKAQNPLSPQDNSQFAAQLAQFSSLEQLTNINTTLTNQTQASSILTQSITNSAAAGLIGKTIKATTNVVSFDGQNPAKLGYNLVSSAVSATVQIRDASGSLVRTLKGSPNQGDNTISWDGKNDNGATMNSGNYTIAVNALNSGGGTIDSSLFTFGKVDGLKFNSNGVSLLVNGKETLLSDVTEVSA